MLNRPFSEIGVPIAKRYTIKISFFSKCNVEIRTNFGEIESRPKIVDCHSELDMECCSPVLQSWSHACPQGDPKQSLIHPSVYT